jgi:hypothetical protein
MFSIEPAELIAERLMPSVRWSSDFVIVATATPTG